MLSGVKYESWKTAKRLLTCRVCESNDAEQAIYWGMQRKIRKALQTLGEPKS